MAALMDFNIKFMMEESEIFSVAELLTNSKFPEIVKFHIECAYEAHNDGTSCVRGKRYLPNPFIYTDISKIDILNFFEQWKALGFESLMDWSSLPAFQKMLAFTLTTCDLLFLDCINVNPHSPLFVVQCNVDKELQFGGMEGEVSYLFHTTYKHCMYSICRNGIKSMTGTSFQINCSTYGRGIYLADDIMHNYNGEAILCFAIKEKGRFKRSYSRNIYVAQEGDICLRAIVWNCRADEISADEIINRIRQHYSE